MSPVRNAERTSVSGTASPSFTRISKGLFASSETGLAAASTIMSGAVERAVDHIHLLVARQPHEIDRISRHANGERRIFVRMLDGIDQRLAIKDVHVHVIAGR